MEWNRVFRVAAAGGYLTLAVLAPLAAQAAQGVYGREIVVGTHGDYSGPLSLWGAAARNGIEMALDEANAAGGIGGRLLRLIAMDDGYEAARAAEAVEELAVANQVFAVLSPLGTPTAQAAASVALAAGVPYLFPLAAADMTPDASPPGDAGATDAGAPGDASPTDSGVLGDASAPEDAAPTDAARGDAGRLLFRVTLSTEEAIADGLRHVLALRRGAEVGVLASDDAFGRAALQGAARELAVSGRAPAAAVSFARRSADYSIPLSWLQDRGVEIVVLGAIGDEALAIMVAARSLRWYPVFLCPDACYTPELAALGGNVVEGLYAVGQVPIPYPNDPVLGGWAFRYQTKFGAIASKQALGAYLNTRLFLAALARAGRTPTQESLRYALESMGPWSDPELGGLSISFSPQDHMGLHSGFLAQVRNGRWIVVTDVNPLRL